MSKKRDEGPVLDLNGLLSELNSKLDDVQSGKTANLSFCYDSRIGEALYRRSRVLSLSRNSSSSQLSTLSPAPLSSPSPPLTPTLSNAYHSPSPSNELSATQFTSIASDGIPTNISAALPPLPPNAKPRDVNSLTESNFQGAPSIHRSITPELSTPPRTPPLHLSSGGGGSGGFGTGSIGVVSAALDRMFRLENLVQLTISNCAVVELPHEVGLLTNLRQLGISSNKLSKLPASFRNLQLLEVFSAAHNHFDAIPAEVLALPR